MKKLLAGVSAFILMFILIPRICLGDSLKGERVVILIMDRIGLGDLVDSDTPNIDYLANNGSIGLMTTNTAGGLNQGNAYVTIGSGARALGTSKTNLAFSAWDQHEGVTVKDLYYQKTGYYIKDENIVNLDILQVIKANENRNYSIHIGALGTALRNANLKTAVIGNCDTHNAYKRYAVSMFMDDQGVVSMGNVESELLMKDSKSPYSIKSDYNKMEDAIDDVWDRANVIAIQLGDTSRAEDFKGEATDIMVERHRTKAIEEADMFIGRVLQRISFEDDMLILLTPMGPAKELAINNRLTPVLMAGPGFARGVLTSGSTKRFGIITNLDIGATILDYFNLKSIPGQAGARAVSVETDSGQMELFQMNTRLVEIHNQRSFLIRSYILMLVIVIPLSMVFILFIKQNNRFIISLNYFLMLIPFVYLLVPLFHQSTAYNTLFISLLVNSMFTAAVLMVSKKTQTRLLIICGIVFLSLIIDQLTGANLIKGSPLGYDVIGGARFYGIGNEYMGVLIGSVCTGSGILLEQNKRLNRIIVSLLMMGVMVVLASPALGANVGGTISAFFAFFLFALLSRGKRINIRHGLTCALLITIILGTIFWVDSLRVVDSQSHMGKTASLIRDNGIQEFIGIINRKISMNIRLFRYTLWTRVFLVSLISIVILFFRPVGVLKKVISDNKMIFFGLVSAVGGGIAAFMTNDSGIIAAATAVIYVSLPVIALTMDKVGKLSHKEDN